MNLVAVLGAVVVAGLLGPASSYASSAGIDPVSGDVLVRAGTGEANRITLREPPDPERLVRVRDGGVPLRAGAGCAAVDAHTADCGALRHLALPMRATQPNVLVDVGDGDDTVVSSMPPDERYNGGQVRIDGGSGDDVLVGAMVLGADGGAGEDVIASADGQFAGFGAVLRGGTGRDYVAGEGFDQISEGDDDGSADHLQGSVVSYQGRSQGVRIDLTRSPGLPVDAEGDLLVGTRTVFGTEHDDVLIGVARANGRGSELYGMGGDDVLRGSYQGDLLHGGAGEDRLNGRGGNDTLIEQTGAISCGSGNDVVELLRRTPGPDCEEYEIGTSNPVRLTASLRGRTLDIGLKAPGRTQRCGPGECTAPGDQVRVKVPLRGASVIFRPVALRFLPRTLRLTLGPRALAFVRRRRGITVRYRSATGGRRSFQHAHLRVRIPPVRPGRRANA